MGLCEPLPETTTAATTTAATTTGVTTTASCPGELPTGTYLQITNLFEGLGIWQNRENICPERLNLLRSSE
ncbi:unnamed protein product [Cylicostephanus goldi]|uniref:Uncharacterized protein n=1 Tax=Cylicostephanus goldi TaxID=71465 RepID=A0A3P7NSL0_CYLGO|nr:unnamed protein product [Cylicostephanus goldi]